jgi:hypothetical protein
MYEPCSTSCDSLGAGVGGGVSARAPNGAINATERMNFARLFILTFTCLLMAVEIRVFLAIDAFR